MTGLDVARRRLASLLLGQGGDGGGAAPARSPADVVGWLAAVQAQDFAGARWAIGQRLADAGATDASVDAAFDSGEVLRVHVLRPTWHAVLPADVRWMQALTAARVRQKMAGHDRDIGLDGRVFARSAAVVVRALEGGKHLTRDELRRALAGAGIQAAGQRLLHILMRAELDALVCNGRRRGKQPTYALLDERAPPGRDRKLAKDQALAELARRYFASHGPAQLLDFSWWSGLTLAEVKTGVAALGDTLIASVVDGKTMFAPAPGPRPRARRGAPVVHLLANFDEITVAYRDRSFTYDEATLAGVGTRADVLSNHLVAVDGEVVGGWRRRVDRRGVVVAMRLLARPSDDVAAALEAAVERLGRFLAMPARLTIERVAPVAKR